MHVRRHHCRKDNLDPRARRIQVNRPLTPDTHRSRHIPDKHLIPPSLEDPTSRRILDRHRTHHTPDSSQLIQAPNHLMYRRTLDVIPCAVLSCSWPIPRALPGPPGGQYGPPGGAPPPQTAPATPQQIAAYRQLLISTIQEKNLQSFYPPERLDRLVQTLVNDAPDRLNRLMHEWSVPMEVATDVMKLALFDVILYVDDSGSIEFEEKGLRKDKLRQILGIVATAASTFDQDGISVRFMNSVESGDGIRSADDVNMLVSRVRFSGLTPLGTSLRNKVIDPMVVGPARANRLDKPVLVITITDGQPAGEPHSAVGDVIRYAVEETSRTRYGRGAVSFQFSQVGNDQRARDFLSDLDEDPQIGHLIDCTSSKSRDPVCTVIRRLTNPVMLDFEVEQDEMSRANPPVHLTRELWGDAVVEGPLGRPHRRHMGDIVSPHRAPGTLDPTRDRLGLILPAPVAPPGPYSPQPGYQAPQQPPPPSATRGMPYGQPYGHGGGGSQPPAGYSPYGQPPPPPRRY
ncbi:hypothetical protein N7512_008918 [Penicillium capsulatum]|nr:hypothetical protein N7512_008918 [Penicillium capsulatum]